MGKRKGSGGFLNKLFRSWKTQQVTLSKPGAQKPASKKRKAVKKVKKAKKMAAPPSARERQVKELQTMYRIGQQDPERLAQIISSMLSEAFMQEQEDKHRFERLLWDKIEKGKPEGEDAQDGSQE